jgi:hypothetical protein
MSPAPGLVLSRRSLITAAAGTAAASTVAGGWSPASARGLPLVRPVWSERVRRSYGVCAHPSFQKSVYGGVDAWSLQLETLGASFFRGDYTAGLSSTLHMVQRCRDLGIRWVMLVAPEDWSMSVAELKATLAHIRDHAADVCMAIEGINEPNTNRDGSRVRPDWARRAVTYQRVIREFVDTTPQLSHVKVVGPSLSLVEQDCYRDFVALRRAGVTEFMDRAGLHSYPGGFKPQHMLDERLRWVRKAWGPVRTWITETGYTTALHSTSGHRPAPADVAATYAPRSVLEGFRRRCKTMRYEMLDDPNPARDDVESNFGLLECPSTDPRSWSLKPEFVTMQRFLASLKDDRPSHQPGRIPLAVDAPPDVRWLLTARSDGSHTLLAYRDASIYDPVHKVRTSARRADLTVTDVAGTRRVSIGADVIQVAVRTER